MIPPELAAPHDTEPVIALAEVDPPPLEEDARAGDSQSDLIHWLIDREGLTYGDAWYRVYTRACYIPGGESIRRRVSRPRYRL